jgi:outer membrane protein assembly factor BamA
LASCRTTKYLEQDQALVKRVEIKGVNKKMSEQAYQLVQNDIRKNSWFNLILYNLFNTKRGKYKGGEPKNIGEAPHLLDSSLVDISRSEIEKLMKTKGYFDAKVKITIKTEKQRAWITFVVDSGPRFKIQNISYVIPDKEVSNLYHANLSSFTHLHKGQTYDEDSLSYDRDQTYLLLQHNGYYEYLKPYMRVTVDTSKKNNQADLKIFIDNPPGKDKHTIYTINNSTIQIRKSDATMDGIPDTAILASQYHFMDYSKHFKAKPLRKYLFIKKEDKFDGTKSKLTYDRLYALNTFKSLKIDFQKVSDSVPRLDVFYDMIPNKRMNNRIEGEYQFNTGRTGFKIANTYSNRNLFGGSELFELNTRYNVLFDATAQGSLFDRILIRDFNIGASISVPALIPFSLPRLGKNGVPYTIFGSNLQIFDQKNIFSNRIFTNSVAYKWSENVYKQHLVTPISIEYRIGKLDSVFKQELLSRGSNLFIKTNDRTFINLGSQYAFTYNGTKLRQLGNFFYFSGALNIAGNSSNLLSKIFDVKTTSDGKRTIFGLPYEQYIKTEGDFRIYRFFGGDRQLVMRLNAGMGIPYGNSNQLAFEKAFFAGGPSGIRAWEARRLGPGGYNRASILQPTSIDTTILLRKNLRYLDQIGEIKLEGNLEYRFKVITKLLGGKLKGAIFTDFGNIWRLRPDPTNSNGEIKINTFFDQLAIGSGLGLRFDVNYFVVRVDMGVKVKDPQFVGSDQWVISQFFKKQAFKDNYAQTNNPDSYNFVQWNFGIGMPF